MRRLSCTSHGRPTSVGQAAVMSAWWKVVIGAVLVVPLLAYVVGPLTPSDADRGDRSRPVIIGDVPEPAAPSPATPTTPPPSPAPAADDDGDDRAGAEGDTDDRARVNNPEPRRLDGRDDADDGGDDADDEAGEGSGERDDDTDGSDGGNDVGDDD